MMRYRENSIPYVFSGYMAVKGVDPDRNQDSRGLNNGKNYKEGTLRHQGFLEMKPDMIINTLLSDHSIHSRRFQCKMEFIYFQGRH